MAEEANDNGKVRAALTLHDIQRDIGELRGDVADLAAMVKESVAKREAGLAEHTAQIAAICKEKAASDAATGVRLGHLEESSRNWGIANSFGAFIAMIVGVFVQRP